MLVRLFGESPSRIIISFDESARRETVQIAARPNCLLKVGEIEIAWAYH
jgi:hypothetical protein